MNKIFLKFYQKKLFTLKEATKIIKNYQVCKNTLKRLISKNQIKRIRNRIYYIVPLDNPDFYPNHIEIASNITQDATIACTSALTARSLWQAEDTLFLLGSYAKTIRIKETTYKILENPYNFGFEEIEYNTGYSTIDLKITDIERTIIDCLRTKSIPFVDLQKILKERNLEISIKKMIKYLEKYKKPILYNKVGLILDMSKDNLKISENDLTDIRKKLSKKTFYLKEKGLRLIKPKYKYYNKWNIMIPEKVFELIPSEALTIKS